MSFKSQKLVVLEANLDDMNPEWYGPLSEDLFAAGALDVTLIPVIMKKSRPAVILQVLAMPVDKVKLLKVLFEDSTTFGVRTYPVERFELKRILKKVQTSYGPVTVKLGLDPSNRIVNAAPEYESCRKISREKKIPIKKIYAEALKKVDLNVIMKK